MTALVLVRDHLNWHDTWVMAAVALVLVGVSLVEVAAVWMAAWLDTRANHEAIQTHVHGPETTYRFIPLRDVEPDHEACTGDGCDATICFCNGTVSCYGTSNVGCLHLTWIGQLCSDCRSQCDECRFEDHTDRALDIARGK